MSDIERQQLKFMDMIAAIVGALDNRDVFQSLVSHSGRQHAQLGVKPTHFVLFGQALIWGLEQQFGPEFAPDLRQAWIALYDSVQGEMTGATTVRQRSERRA
jgi:hemoglobin-like flavoprotein